MAYGSPYSSMTPAYTRKPTMGAQNPSHYDQGVVRFPTMGAPGKPPYTPYDPGKPAPYNPGKPGSGPVIYEPVRPWHQQPAYTPRGMSARRPRPQAYDYMPPNAF